ncbi:hypothetical protein [Chryseobacterium sp. CT-SW4]|uniref:hypothetical protein n=1 Tax=Chryseobacterium sp. SW-1 TaxID=3157343 RepID=UPI003B012FFF
MDNNILKNASDSSHYVQEWLSLHMKKKFGEEINLSNVPFDLTDDDGVLVTSDPESFNEDQRKYFDELIKRLNETSISVEDLKNDIEKLKSS